MAAAASSQWTDSLPCGLLVWLQLETARANELQAHGTELQRLERELASRREQEQHLQRLVASLRADKCCADAQVQTLQRKWEQQQETDAKVHWLSDRAKSHERRLMIALA